MINGNAFTFNIASYVIDGLSVWSPLQFVGTSFGSATSFKVALPQGPQTTISIDTGDGSTTTFVLNSTQSATFISSFALSCKCYCKFT